MLIKNKICKLVGNSTIISLHKKLYAISYVCYNLIDNKTLIFSPLQQLEVVLYTRKKPLNMIVQTQKDVPFPPFLSGSSLFMATSWRLFGQRKTNFRLNHPFFAKMFWQGNFSQLTYNAIQLSHLLPSQLLTIVESYLKFSHATSLILFLQFHSSITIEYSKVR